MRGYPSQADLVWNAETTRLHMQSMCCIFGYDQSWRIRDDRLVNQTLRCTVVWKRTYVSVIVNRIHTYTSNLYWVLEYATRISEVRSLGAA